MRIRWENSERRRFYEQRLTHQDCVNDITLHNIWGAIGSAKGGEKLFVVQNEIEGIDIIIKESKRRLSRGYQVTDIIF